MPSKRSRACDACHAIKIKCNLGSEGGDPPCTRCTRLSKDCVVTPPKRQKDRVAELEAQVAALTRLLESQNIQANSPPRSTTTPPLSTPTSPSTTLTTATSKKRRLEDATPREDDEKVDSETSDGLAGLDLILDASLQRLIFENYVQGMMPNFTPVSLTGEVEYDRFRSERPLLFQAFVYSACHATLPVDQKEEVSRHVTELLVRRATDRAKKSLDIIQAIHTVTLWFQFPKYHTTITGASLRHYALDIAKELGLEGQHGKDYEFDVVTHTDSDAAWSSWLFCHLLSANMGILARRPNPLPWTEHEEILLMMLNYWPQNIESNRLTAQYVRAERLCEALISSYLITSETPMTAVDPSFQATLSQRTNLITDWRVQMPPSLPPTGRLALCFWEHYATLILHEAVLHTSTNTMSFCAPFTAERLSITDFPAPAIVTPQHVNSLCVIRDACHAFTELYVNLPLTTLTALPPILFAVRHLYSVCILLRVYIACTAPGNTFGAYIDLASLRVDELLGRNIDLCERLHNFDSTSLAARLSSANARSKEWIINYRMTQGIPVPTQDTGVGFSNLSSPSTHAIGGMNGNAIGGINGMSTSGLDFDQNNAFDWNDLPPLSNDPFGAFEYGLEDFFAEPFPDFGGPYPQA